MNGWLKAFLIIGLLGLFVNFIKKAKNNDASENVINTNTDIALKSNKGWQYEAYYDKMNEKNVMTATIIAEESLDFDFPYNGGSTASLSLVQGRGNPILRVTKGHFIFNYDAPDIKIKINDGPVKSIYCEEPNDGSTDIMFLPNKYNSLIKNANKIMIEVEFYQEGLKTLTFNCDKIDTQKFK